jgi:hypothetical protein
VAVASVFGATAAGAAVEARAETSPEAGAAVRAVAEARVEAVAEAGPGVEAGA